MNNFESGKFRHELKYLCSEVQLSLIGGRIGKILRPDPYAGENGAYHIRSLYFDDYDNRCYYENENGVDVREKFRIRIYNRSSNHIKLEVKRKVHGKTQKSACPITVEQIHVLLLGQALPMSDDYPSVLQKLCLEYRTRLMRPVVIIEYERTPFIYSDGNLRMTFDKNIMSSTQISSFFDVHIPKKPILGTGQHILEIKYDQYLPGFLRQYLQLDSLSQTTFSKYYIGRKLAL